MYIVDTHCDSLLRVNSENGLVNPHNISKKHPQLQLFAEFVPAKGMPAEYRLRQIFHYLDIYIAETQRLDIIPVRDCQELNYAIEHGMVRHVDYDASLNKLIEELQELIELYEKALSIV